MILSRLPKRQQNNNNSITFSNSEYLLYQFINNGLYLGYNRIISHPQSNCLIYGSRYLLNIISFPIFIHLFSQCNNVCRWILRRQGTVWVVAHTKNLNYTLHTAATRHYYSEKKKLFL